MLTCSVLGNLVWKIRCGIAARSRRRYTFPVRAGLPASVAFVRCNLSLAATCLLHSAVGVCSCEMQRLERRCLEAVK